MEIRFYNTLVHGMALFSALRPPGLSMYNCGPTVYDYAHIGNFRAFLFADVLRRFLELANYQVHQVMNITDVGHMTDDALADGGGQDKMQLAIERIKVAKKSGQLPNDAVADPTDPNQVAAFFTQAFLEDAKQLGLKVADEFPNHMPRATQHIDQMQQLIATLLARGHAYVARDKAVYYSVESFPEYGRLSGNPLDRLRGGSSGRVLEEHQAHKRHPADFLLWKPDPSHVMKWNSPWGMGYPGWHIECSAMAMSCLGHQTIDIHTGGEDNIFPHHECEIAQSCGATGQPFARFWLHARFLLVEGQKMSKSKGNFLTVRDCLEGKVTGRPVDAAVLRFELFKAHYRSNMNFTVKGLEDSAGAVQRLREFSFHLQKRVTDADSVQVDSSHPVLGAFVEALSDDLNMSAALAVVFKWIGGPLQDSPAVSLAVLRKIDSVLGVLEPLQQEDGQSIRTVSPTGSEQTVQDICRQIDVARAVRDFETADRLRQQLIGQGFEVGTTPAGTVVRRKLA